jgi:hypothetical protein
MSKADILQDGDKTIKITIALDNQAAQPEKSAQPEHKPWFHDEARLLELVNLAVIPGQRNTEHGLTPVRLVEFRDEAQRKKIIELIGSSFESVIEQLAPLLYLLGAHPRAAIRNRIAEAVGELMSEIDFIRYKEMILIPWALSAIDEMNIAAATALAAVAKDERHVNNVKALVGHWVTTSNFNLNWTGTASCVLISTIWPAETLDLLERALKHESFKILPLASLVVRQLCDNGHVGDAFERLAEWLKDRDNSVPFRTAAALLFLMAIELTNVIGKEDRAVDMFLIGLGDQRLIDATEIRDGMLNKLKSWGQESLKDSMPPQASPEAEDTNTVELTAGSAKRDTMLKIFQRMYVRAGTPREKDRIKYWIQRWRKENPNFAQITPNVT